MNFIRIVAFVGLVTSLLMACSQPKETQSADTTVAVVDTNTADTTTLSAPAEATSTADSIPAPAGFTQLKEATGDLTKDGQDERVIVYDTPKQTGMGTERQLYIYTRENNAWKLLHTSTGPVLPSEHGGTMGDPFDHLAVERGTVVIGHFGGSRQKWNYTHRYRFQQGDWYLIGATIGSGDACESESYDYNVSTGKIQVQYENDHCDDAGESQGETTTEKFTFTHKPAAPIKMDGFYPGDNEVSIPNKDDKTFYY